MMNNDINISEYKIKLECMICETYKLSVPKYVKIENSSDINSEYRDVIKETIPLIFEDIGAVPVKLVTYSKECDLSGKLITSPHDFILNNGKSLSIKINKTKSTSFKIAPRVIGQAGYNVLNSYFGEYYGRMIETQQDIKTLFYNKVDVLLPILLEKTFISDYTVFVQLGNEKNFTIIDKEKIKITKFKKQDLEFTKLLEEWNESNSLKYKGITIAEIQTHKFCTFKFRFILNNILQFVYDNY